jgi:4-amino-4-deoxy-L-arabinose transferase-like glycosyltransferase
MVRRREELIPAFTPNPGPSRGEMLSQLRKYLALPALLALIYLPALGNPSSGTHPDESYYLGISAEMDANGAWLTPTIDGQARWFKPPLLYWAERVCYAVFGRGFFAGRLPAALTAIALALVTRALGARLYGDEAGERAALLVATTFGFAKFGRIAMMDAPMALAFTAAAYGAWRASEEGKPAALLGVGLAAGITFLLKGPVGAVLVLFIVGGFLALRRPALLASRWTLLAFLVGALVGLPWYLISLFVHGERFFHFFFVEQNLDRFQHPWTLAGEATLLVGFLAFLLPWTFLFASSLPSRSRLRDPAILLPVVWIAAVLLVFTVPSLKWPHYGLACTPAAALLMSRRAPKAWARLATSAFLALLALAAASALLLTPSALAAAALVATALLLLLAAGLVYRSRLAESAAAVALGYALVLGVVVPAVNPKVIPEPALTELRGRNLFVYGYVPGIFTLAAGRPVHRVEGEAVEQALEAGGVVIFPAGRLAEIPEGLREKLTPVASWKHIRGYMPTHLIWESLAARDASPLFEPMWAMEMRDRAGAAASE